ncbi:hypothetical protein VTP01DRAFT_9119, partial [Rhizomucor pusillus]|uniref:uncharacterized protein n=1 Tax=Rhizomucor pusillus TaxID=4840 RepID=UPI003742B5DC
MCCRPYISVQVWVGVLHIVLRADLGKQKAKLVIGTLVLQRSLTEPESIQQERKYSAANQSWNTSFP